MGLRIRCVISNPTGLRKRSCTLGGKPVGLPLRKFFNTSGLAYRALSLKEKLPEMSEEQQLKLLASDGMLVKRPVLVKEGLVLVGFRQKEWEEALLP